MTDFNKIKAELDLRLDKLIQDLALTTQSIKSEIKNINTSLSRIEKSLEKSYYQKNEVDKILLELQNGIDNKIHMVNVKTVKVENVVESHEISNKQIRKTVIGLITLIVMAVFGAILKTILK